MTDILRTRVTLQVNGVSCLMQHYWDRLSVTPDTAVATEALARVRAMLNSAAARVNAFTVATFDTSVAILTAETGQLTGVVTGSAPAAVSFTGAGDQLPGMVQGLARFGTNSFINGRNIKGRSFIPGPSEGDNGASGFPSSAYLTAWNTALGLLGTTVVSNIAQVVWHRPHPSTHLGGASLPVTSRAMASSWATQKGRRL